MIDALAWKGEMPSPLLPAITCVWPYENEGAMVGEECGYLCGTYTGGNVGTSEKFFMGFGSSLSCASSILLACHLG